MTKTLKISIDFILSIFLLITIFPITSESAQDNPFESYEIYLLDQANYWNNRFNSAWYSGEYGTFFPQDKYLYDYTSYSGYEFPEITLMNPWLWTSYEHLLYSGLPLGCHLILEEKTCVSRGACSIPIYCPMFISNSLWLSSSRD